MWLHLVATWRSGWRSRSARLLLVLSLFVLLGAWVGGTFSPRQPQTVAVDVGLSLIRLLATLLGVFWAQDLLGKDIERRSVVVIAAYPQSRTMYLLGRYCGILALLATSLTILALVLVIFVRYVSPNYHQALPPHLAGFALPLTMCYIWLDIAVVVAFALLIASLSTVSMLPMFLSVAFAVAARSIGSVLAYMQTFASRDESAQMHSAVHVIAWLLPDLDRLDIRQMVLYGAPLSAAELIWPALMAAAYVCVLMAAANFVFARREFT